MPGINLLEQLLLKSGFLLLGSLFKIQDFPGGSDGKASCLQCRKPRFNSWAQKIPWRRKWQSTPALLPGKSHGRRSLIGYSPWGCKESDMTERLHFTSRAELEKEMATHSSILAWEIPWTEETGGLQSVGLQKNQTRR